MAYQQSRYQLVALDIYYKAHDASEKGNGSYIFSMQKAGDATTTSWLVNVCHVPQADPGGAGLGTKPRSNGGGFSYNSNYLQWIWEVWFWFKRTYSLSRVL